jgi:hypothetical protein
MPGLFPAAHLLPGYSTPQVVYLESIKKDDSRTHYPRWPGIQG